MLQIKLHVFCYLYYRTFRLLVSLRNKTAERGGRQNGCVTNVTGLLRACPVVIFAKYQCFCGLLQKDLFKGR